MSGAANTKGVSLTFTPDTGPLQRHLAALVAEGAGDGLQDLRREIGEYMVGEIQDNLDGQKLFDGSPMPQSKAAMNRKGGSIKKLRGQGRSRRQASVARGGKTLIDTHRLYDSYVYQLPRGGTEVGSNLVYAAINHFGGETGPVGHRFEMEARPVMGIGPEQDRHIMGLILAELRSMEPRAGV